ncbi:MAG: methyltransferase domain-containing protein [Candidatus Omnitrophica bacterium]|nr:methyltransferase domain-containing protein [Candidatus Omnitrophota bacterium]
MYRAEERTKYIKTQIERSRKKFSYCKVSMKDILRYIRIIKEHRFNEEIGPVVCMGTRNGREVDLFRIALNSPRPWSKIIQALESGKPYPHSLLPCVEGMTGRSSVTDIKENAVVGAEINPDARRKDIFIGSFDELPEKWSGRFSVLFSNSFDHSMDPQRTVKEWLRVIKPGGMLIILWGEAESTEADPLGNITEEYLTGLFKLRKLEISGSQSVCGYKELFLVKDRTE